MTGWRWGTLAVLMAGVAACGGGTGDGAADSSADSGGGVTEPAPVSDAPAPSVDVLALGAKQYAAQCAICHDSATQAGVDGNGLFPIDPGKFPALADLSQYIERFMPTGAVGSCDKTCSDAVAAFIRNSYSQSAAAPAPAPAPAPADDFVALPAGSALRKVKSLLTGLAPTDADLAAGTARTALQAQIDRWMQTPEFEQKMVLFFSTTFQQNAFSLTDFQFQLRDRPGALGVASGIFGESAFPLLMKNVQESMGRTAWQLVKEGRPLTDVLTTDRFMMTTALKSLYMQIEANNDRLSDPNVLKWKFNYGRRPALADSLNPDSPDFMVFGHEAPSSATVPRRFSDNCDNNADLVAQFPGNVSLFHLLLGSVDRDAGGNRTGLTNTGCFERATKPYFTAADLSDWQMVQIVKGTRIEPWELLKLRASGATLPSAAQRIGFFTTPAFMATWNTNDSNSHRVTVNQSLLAALGLGFSSATQVVPLPPNTAALDGAHAVDGSECFACHKSLDPMRQFFQNWYLETDKPKSGNGAGPQPSFGFANVTGNGRTLLEFGGFIKQVKDERVVSSAVNRFALEMTQKLCFFANSARCDETDPEMRRIAQSFEAANFGFKTLVRELFASPLVTAASRTKTFDTSGAGLSIARRDQLCQALSNRLGIDDVCQIALPNPATPSRLAKLAGAVPADTFSRGVAEPVTPSDPNVFYRSATELMCEAVATTVVDGTGKALFSSGNVNAAIESMVSLVMGVPPGDAKHAPAVAILKSHQSAAVQKGASASNALRSTFTAACLSPSNLGLGI